MYYKANNQIGLRRKFDDKAQCIKFGGRWCNLSEAVLRDWAADCLRRLDAGEPEKQVEEWVQEAIKP